MDNKMIDKLKNSTVNKEQIELAINTSKKLHNSLKNQSVENQKEHLSSKIFDDFAKEKQ